MDLFDTMIHHTSVREFTDEKISDSLKSQLIAAAQSVSSSNFVQAYSIIEVQSTDKLKKIEALSHNPGFISQSAVFYVFVADLNRHSQLLQSVGKDTTPLTTTEPLLISVVDTALSAQGLATFAESQGLGICYIGGLRNSPFEITELLHLPKLTIPLFGLAVGYPKNKNQVKPRLPQAAVHFVDGYHFDTIEIKKYDELTAGYYQQRNMSLQETSWSKKMIDFFDQQKRPFMKDFLIAQGFTELN